jgi:hypothetical protein
MDSTVCRCRPSTVTISPAMIRSPTVAIVLPSLLASAAITSARSAAATIGPIHLHVSPRITGPATLTAANTGDVPLLRASVENMSPCR